MIYGNVSNDFLTPNVAVAGVVAGIVTVALGVFGNVLVILAVLQVKSLCRARNMFVLSLAVCDLFQVALVRPLYIYTYSVRSWQFSPGVCLYALYASNLALLESILHVAAIACYRYLLIVHPRLASYIQGKRVVGALISLIYLLPLSILLLPSIKRLTKPLTMNQDIIFNTRIMFCCYVKEVTVSPLAGITKKLLFLGVTGVVLLFCYVRIYQTVHKSGRIVTSQGGMSAVRLQTEITLLKTLLVVLASFTVTYLPLSVLYALDRDKSMGGIPYLVTVTALWSSSCINWMIYGLMNKQYLQAYRYILTGKQTSPPGERGSSRQRSNSRCSQMEFRRQQYNISSLVYSSGSGKSIKKSSSSHFKTDRNDVSSPVHSYGSGRSIRLASFSPSKNDRNSVSSPVHSYGSGRSIRLASFSHSKPVKTFSSHSTTNRSNVVTL